MWRPFSAAAAAASALRPVRGMRDLFGPSAAAHSEVVSAFRALALRYGCEEAATPILERTAVFSRTLGEASDVVTKEMYSFMPPGHEGDEPDATASLTLRPEGTAGIMRALISGGLLRQAGSAGRRLFYHGPMFRHERPQQGRQRQFHQVGVEFVGGAHADLDDAEAIAAAHGLIADVARAAQAGDVAARVRLLVNTLGDEETMRGYSAALRAHFEGCRGALSPDSQARLARGSPLRILDSKDPQDAAPVAAAPSIHAHLSPAAGARFERLLAALRGLGIPHTVDPRLVRGLDYYRHAIFEFVLPPAPAAVSRGGGGPGQWGTLLAGGRYDGLCAAMGGPAGVGAVGWAAGVERLVGALVPVQPPPAPPALAVVVCSSDGGGASVGDDGVAPPAAAPLPPELLLGMLVARAARHGSSSRASASVFRCRHMGKGLAVSVSRLSRGCGRSLDVTAPPSPSPPPCRPRLHRARPPPCSSAALRSPRGCCA